MTTNFRSILFISILGSKGVVLSEKVRWATKTLLRGCVCSGTALIADYEIATGTPLWDNSSSQRHPAVLLLESPARAGA